jgi:hypothetical protein
LRSNPGRENSTRAGMLAAATRSGKMTELSPFAVDWRFVVTRNDATA